MAEKITKSPRADSRRSALLDEAARLFRYKGFRSTTVRDIVSAANMTPGSLYCHFSTKESLLAEVYQLGINEIFDSVSRAIAIENEPLKRLKAACVAHLEALLRGSDYPQVAVRVLPEDVPFVRDDLVRLRDKYEMIFTLLIDDLPLPKGYDRGFLRRLIISGLNSISLWYRPSGETPEALARKLLNTLQLG